MKICCVSDLHGFLPEIPDCDLLLLAGDYCPHRYNQHRWFQASFAPWVNALAERMKVIGIAGNHDLMFEKFKHRIPEMNWTYLDDSGTEWDGLSIYGTPWQPRFFDWAFNADEPELEAIWQKIPARTDILLLHGPPQGYGDLVPRTQERTGSPSLLKRIEEVQPRLMVAGHIHAGYGHYQIGKTVFLHASHVNEEYQPVNPPHLIEL